MSGLIVLFLLLQQLDGVYHYLYFPDDSEALIAVGDEVTRWNVRDNSTRTLTYVDAIFYTEWEDIRITGDSTASITTWDENDNPIATVKADLDGDFVPAYAAKDGVIAVGGCLQPEPDESCAVALVQVYDVMTLEKLYELSGQLELITGLAFGDERLATVTRDGSLWVWDVTALEVIHKLTPGETEITDVAYSGGSVVSSLCTLADENGCVESQIIFFDVENGEPAQSLTVAGTVNDFDIVAERIAIVTDANLLAIYDIESGEVLFEREISARVVKLSLTEDVVAVAGDAGVSLVPFAG